MGRRVSSPSDFPSTAVYEREGPAGAGYVVAFDNLEFVTDTWTVLLTAIGAILLIGGTVWAVLFWEGTVRHYGVSGWWVAGLIVAVWVGLFFKFKQPWKIKRAIDLDRKADRLRVFRNGRLQAERQLERLVNLTVEDHPDAELSRLNRQERGQKRPSMNEKQHCLIGWFGAGGAEQVILLTRAEFPSRHSLFEVRQAILWALAQGDTGPVAPEIMGEKRGIKPPLD